MRLPPPRPDTKARRRRVPRAWSTPRRCSRAIIRACGATSCRSPTRATSRRPSRSPDACSRAATTWTAAACRRRAGCRCWWASCTTPRPRPPPRPRPRPRPPPRRTPTSSTRSTSSTCRSAPVRPPTPPPTRRRIATDTTRWVASRCGCTTTGSWCRGRASAGGPTTSRATCAAAPPASSERAGCSLRRGSGATELPTTTNVNLCFTLTFCMTLTI